MKITLPGRDIVVIDDENVFREFRTERIHLIRLKISDPDIDAMSWIHNAFPSTNRFVIDMTNLKFYNIYFKNTSYKYYVINTYKKWNGVISFFKKNNKVLLDFTKLLDEERDFLLNFALKDVLNNTEVVLIDKNDYANNQETFNNWRGNCIIKNNDYEI